MKILRYDASKLDIAPATPSGGKRITAHVTRTGVLVYKLSDGTERRELRHPDEVFAPESLASLDGATVTDDHPPAMVDPSNWRSVAIGHAQAPVQIPGEPWAYVQAELSINHGDALERIGVDLVECSMGYFAEYDPTPGEYNGEAYDGVQRRIRYNHVALGPIGWGRAGGTVNLKLDSKDDSVFGVTEIERNDGAQMVKVKFNGAEYEAGSQAHCDAIDTEIKRLSSLLAEATERADRAAKDLAEAKARADKAEQAREFDRIARALATRGVKVDKKDEGDMGALVLKCLKVFAPNFDPQGKSPEQLAGALELALSMAAPAAAAEEPPAPEGDALQEGALGAEETDKPAAGDSIHSIRLPATQQRSNGLSLAAIQEQRRKYDAEMAFFQEREQ